MWCEVLQLAELPVPRAVRARLAISASPQENRAPAGGHCGEVTRAWQGS
ncbi:MAG TPA: hypothetical protein VN408_13205 [Actinoplanes sp.]|nr:hypothetical protein [Actinoplanes sp.]